MFNLNLIQNFSPMKIIIIKKSTTQIDNLLQILLLKFKYLLWIEWLFM